MVEIFIDLVYRGRGMSTAVYAPSLTPAIL